MSQQFQQQFQTMVQSGQPQEALTYAKQYLREHLQEIESWWFLAITVTIPEIQRQCCTHIIKQDPTHSAAQAMLERLSRTEDTAEPDIFENPLGAPTENTAWDTPFKTMFVDEEPANEDGTKPWENIKPPPRKVGFFDKKRNLMLVSMLGLLIIWGIAGVVYYFVFYHPDPSVNLTESISNDDFTVKYPDDWVANKYLDGRIMFLNHPVSGIEESDLVNPWQFVSGEPYGSSGFLQFYNLFLKFLFSEDDEDFVMVVMQPIPQDANDLIDTMIERTDRTYDRNLITYDIQINSTKQDAIIGGVVTSMTYLSIVFEEAFNFGESLHIHVYYVSAFKDNQYYLFTLMVAEKDVQDWSQVAHDFTENIRFH